MSYTNSYHHTIRLPYSLDVSYPPSEHGGTKHVSGHIEDVIYVDIEVDTDPFDASVEDCNEHVLGLTASVGAMNTAQCASVRANSKKIAKAVINGFFSTVKSDLTAQRAQLQQAVEARLLLLRQQAQTLLEKRKDMEQNYARTSARYIKIFDDLNHELENRVHQIDQPIFKAIEAIDVQHERMQCSDLIPSVSSTSSEASILHAQLSAATTRHNAQQAIALAHNFLTTHAKSIQTIEKTTLDGTGQDTYYVPVCYFESIADGGLVTSEVHAPRHLKLNGQSAQKVSSAFVERSQSEDTVSRQRNQLQSYLQNEIALKVTGADEHAQRVRSYINKLFNNN